MSNIFSFAQKFVLCKNPPFDGGKKCLCCTIRGPTVQHHFQAKLLCLHSFLVSFSIFFIGCFPLSALRKQISAHGVHSKSDCKVQIKSKKRDAGTPFFCHVL